MRKLFLVALSFLFCFLLASCASEVTVTWFDADGTVLYTETILDDQQIPQKDLPQDTDEWHYTAWEKKDISENILAFFAKREEITKVIWKDVDGTILNEQIVFGDSAMPEFPLPTDTGKWDYTEWLEEKNENVYIYTAQRVPSESYFYANIFQIVTKDISGNQLSTGTGFVFNSDGWFITNSHVMDGAFSANAIFEINDKDSGEHFTTLEIKFASYNDPDKNIFIGKISDYDKLSDYYCDIKIQNKYFAGETTYSIGYPYSSTDLEINKGTVREHTAMLSSKLKGGVSYVATDSFILSGSSGGILVNEDLEVIGITTLGVVENNDFVIGAAIEANIFLNLMQNTSNDDLKKLVSIISPDEAAYLQLIDFIEKKSKESPSNGFEYKKGHDDNGAYYEILYIADGANNEQVSYHIKESTKFYLNMQVVFKADVFWTGGDSREVIFKGTYSPRDKLDNFYFDIKYIWASGIYIRIYSDDINYSENIESTLLRHKTEVSHDYVILDDDDIEYFKNEFNKTYKYVLGLIERYV